MAPMGREPFERVGACQTLARQTAPTALVPAGRRCPLVAQTPENALMEESVIGDLRNADLQALRPLDATS